MTRQELGKLYPIFLKDYNFKWNNLFLKEKQIVLSIFNKNLKIEHIGSTAIKSIKAKPTIDILLEKPKNFTNDQIIKKMESNDYIYMKEQTKHIMFVKGYTPKGLANESYHIHIGPLSQSWLWDRLYFRDYLNENKDEAKVYEKLKIRLAEKYKNDRETYTQGKSKYIERITRIAKKSASVK